MNRQEEAMLQQGYVRASAAAEMAKASIQTVYRWLDEGTPPHGNLQGAKLEGVQVVGHRYVKVESLAKLLGPEASAALGLFVASDLGATAKP